MCAYLMYQLNGAIGFWPAILASAVLVGLLGMAFESTLIRPLYKRLPEYTLLLTFGTALIFAQIVRRVWGDDAVRVSTPSYIPDSISLTSVPSWTFSKRRNLARGKECRLPVYLPITRLLSRTTP